jgi:copper chaperone CopZ
METKFNISGMHCDSCAKDIQETLAETAGVERAEVVYADRQATVVYNDDVVQPQTLAEKIQELGYEFTISGQSQSEVGA